MDDYEIQQALESIASAASVLMDSTEPSTEIAPTVQRWKKLFQLDDDDALDCITRHRNDLSRLRLSDAHWLMVREEMENAGYDREAFEYELNLEKSKALLDSDLSAVHGSTDDELCYLLELKGPLEDVATVCSVAGLNESPVVVKGTSTETWEAIRLCCIDAKARKTLLRWAVANGHDLTILVDPRSMSGP